jgi:hypothetical protein
MLPLEMTEIMSQLIFTAGNHDLAIETVSLSARDIAGRIRVPAIAPSPTLSPALPYHDIYRRFTEDRKVPKIGKCILNTPASALDYPAPWEYLTYSLASQISKFWVVSQSSSEGDNCYAGYAYSTNSLVGSRVRLFDIHDS